MHINGLARRSAVTCLAVASVFATTSAFTTAAQAADVQATSVIAQDTTAPPAPVSSAVVVGVDANIVRGLTVTGARGKTVTVSARGTKPRTVKSSKTAPVVIRGLIPGKAYNVAIGGVRIGTATPLAAPGATYGLTVATTNTKGQVQLTWKQQAAPAQGSVTYEVSADRKSVV